MSKNDGQYHYITARQLAYLYGVRLEDCEIHLDLKNQPLSLQLRQEEREAGLIRLTPRYNGDYTLPDA